MIERLRGVIGRSLDGGLARMRIFAGRFLAMAMLVAIVAVSFPAFDARGQPQEPTALEMAQLPKFCWGQFRVPNATGDEFRIRDCGVYSNHYCYALMYLVRARSPRTNKQGRVDLLGHADVDIRYTEHGIKDYPKCSIRDNVLKSRIEVDNLLRMYGGKPMPPAK